MTKEEWNKLDLRTKEETYEMHDCHLTAEDSCSICELWTEGCDGEINESDEFDLKTCHTV